MPIDYKGFLVPEDSDPGDVPKSFRDFIDNGLLNGSVIAHFSDLQTATAALASGNYPDGSMAWVGAILHKVSGGAWTPVLTPESGTVPIFPDTASRNSHFSAPNSPAAGQLAMILANSGSYGQFPWLSVWSGSVWVDTADLHVGQHALPGNWTVGNTLSVGNTLNAATGNFSANITANGLVSRYDVNASRNISAAGTINAGVNVTGNGVVSRYDIVAGRNISASGGLDIRGVTTLRNHSFVTGNLIVSGGVVQGSDERLKTDISSSPDRALDVVERTPVRSFFFGDKGRNEYGFIAQEVEETLPTAVVHQDLDEGIETPSGDTIDEFLALDSNEMVATLWKAVQELSNEVRDLKAQLAS